MTTKSSQTEKHNHGLHPSSLIKITQYDDFCRQVWLEITICLRYINQRSGNDSRSIITQIMLPVLANVRFCQHTHLKGR